MRPCFRWFPDPRRRAGWLLGAALLGDPEIPSRFVVTHPVPPHSGGILVGFTDAEGARRPAQSVRDGLALVLHDQPEGLKGAWTPMWESTDQVGTETGVRVTQESGGPVRILVAGQPFTEYRTEQGRKPCFYPVRFQGDAMTRAWPLAEDAGEEQDHPHHRSLWFSYGDVNGHDLWSEQGQAGFIRRKAVDRIVSGPVFGSFRARHDWCTEDGTLLCEDQRTLRVYATRPEQVFDYEITLVASQGPVVFGDTKEGMMAWRVPATMRLRGPLGQGHIVNSEGLRDGDTWGARAAWCDYHGPVDGAVRGIAMLDHPDNLRHPTWWHVRDYGLFAANPFGRHYFEGAPAGAGRHVLEEGERLTFRYRFVLHDGDEVEGEVFRHAAAWSRFRLP